MLPSMDLSRLKHGPSGAALLQVVGVVASLSPEVLARHHHSSLGHGSGGGSIGTTGEIAIVVTIGTVFLILIT
jgi:hypothetical protein